MLYMKYSTVGIYCIILSCVALRLPLLRFCDGGGIFLISLFLRHFWIGDLFEGFDRICFSNAPSLRAEI